MAELGGCFPAPLKLISPSGRRCEAHAQWALLSSRISWHGPAPMHMEQVAKRVKSCAYGCRGMRNPHHTYALHPSLIVAIPSPACHVLLVPFASPDRFATCCQACRTFDSHSESNVTNRFPPLFQGRLVDRWPSRRTPGLYPIRLPLTTPSRPPQPFLALSTLT